MPGYSKRGVVLAEPQTTYERIDQFWSCLKCSTFFAVLVFSLAMWFNILHAKNTVTFYGIGRESIARWSVLATVRDEFS